MLPVAFPDMVTVFGSPGVLLLLGYLLYRLHRIERLMTSVQTENLLQAVRIRKLEAHNGLPHPEQLAAQRGRLK